KDAAFGALTAVFPNSGFMGVPMLATLMGPLAAGPVITTLLVDLLLTSSVCIALGQGDPEHGLRARTAFVRSLGAAARDRLQWAIDVVMSAALTRFRLCGPIDTIVRMLGDSATPVAMLTIGTVLWRARAHVHNRTPAARYVPIALVKLFVHP